MTWRGNPRTGTRAWRIRRQLILHRDGARCYRCGRAAHEVDHVIPLAEGGTDDDRNLAAICTECHRTKSSSEGGRARARARGTIARPPEDHPGIKR